MNRILLISFLSAALAAGIYFAWKANTEPPIHTWDLVPDDALIVYEQNQNSKSGANWFLQFVLPDSIRKQIITKTDLLLSVHSIGKEEFGILLYLPDAAAQESKIVSYLKGSGTVKERVFEGFTIKEITYTKNKTVALTSVGKVVVVASTALLIEDVLRIAKSDERKTFRKENRALYQFTTLEADEGRAYLNLDHLAQFANTFLSADNQLALLQHFAKSGVLDIQKQEQSLLFSGFALDSLENTASILSVFDRQRPVPITLQRLVSQRTGALVHFGMSDVMAWNQDRITYCKAIHLPVADSLQSLASHYSFDAATFYKSLGDEMGSCLTGIFEKGVFVVEMKDAPSTLAQFKKLNRKTRGDSSTEKYSHYEIHALVDKSIPLTLFAPLTNKQMEHYLVLDNYLVLSEDIDDLKAFADDFDNDNTWGKSSEWNEFLSTSQETNAGMIFDALNAGPAIRDQLNTKWQLAFDSTHFLDMGKGSFQFGRLEKSYYFNGVVDFNSQRPKPTAKGKEKSTEVALAQSISYAPIVVKNHTNNSKELLLQDDANNLILLTPKLKSQFTSKVSGKIRSEISQIDFYKNKKLQYLFATENSICLVDRLGNTVKGFPKAIKTNSKISYLTPFDPDNSRNYKFLATDEDEVITLYTADAVALAEWKTSRMDNDLWVAPRVIKSNGTSFIVAVTTDGSIYVFNTTGKLVNNFPVRLKIRPRGTWTLEKAGGVDAITLVGEDGSLSQVDLNGKVVGSSNLIKSSTTSKFALVSTPWGDGAVVSRVDKQKIGVLNISGTLIFEAENPGSEEVFLSYFEGEHGEKIFSFSDPQQDFMYFFNEKGRPIFSQPLEGEQRPAVIAEKQGAVYFYTFDKNKVRRFERLHINQ